MRCGCGSELTTFSLRATVACNGCGETMSTGFGCEAVRDLVCGTCAGRIDAEFAGQPECPHKGECFAAGFEDPVPDAGEGGDSKET